eukprot:4523519-Amphidinium_carterae.1
MVWQPRRDEESRGGPVRACAASTLKAELGLEGAGVHGANKICESEEEIEAEGKEDIRIREAEVGAIIDELMTLFVKEIPKRLNHHTSATRELLPLLVLE